MMPKSKSSKLLKHPPEQDPTIQPSPTFQPAPADHAHQHSPSMNSSAHSGHDFSRSTGSSADPSGSITSAALAAPLSLSLTPQVVQVIDTTKWPAPSPDPSGMAYIPGTGLLM